jgi:predicted nucleotidyltransferase
MEATLLAELTAELQSFFAARADVESAAIFGSVARGEDGPDSDVDIIVAGWLASSTSMLASGRWPEGSDGQLMRACTKSTSCES